MIKIMIQLRIDFENVLKNTNNNLIR